MSRRCIACLLVACFAVTLTPGLGAFAAGRDTGRPGSFLARDGEIYDSQGRIAYFRGVNVAGNAKVAADCLPFQPGETRWWEYLKSWGFNLVRFTVFWEGIEPEEGRYDEAYLGCVKQLLQEAAKRDIYIMVDMHQDLFSRWLKGDGAPRWVVEECGVNPDSNDGFGGQFWGLANALSRDVKKCYRSFWESEHLKEHYREAFVEVAQSVKDNDHVLGYDIFNEPQAIDISNVGGHFENDILKPFYEETILALRDVDPDAIGFVEPVATEMYSSKLTPFNVGNLVYANHLYDTIANTFKVMILPDRLMFTVLHKAEKDKAKELGMPLLVGECGAPWNLWPQGGHDKVVNDLYTVFENGFTSSALWDYSVRDVDVWNAEDYSLIDRNGQPRGLETVARPYVRRLNGTPVKQTFNRCIKKYELEFYGEAGGPPTVASVPASIQYPVGFNVSVSDGKWRYASGKRELSYFPGSGGKHRVVITKR